MGAIGLCKLTLVPWLPNSAVTCILAGFGESWQQRQGQQPRWGKGTHLDGPSAHEYESRWRVDPRQLITWDTG